MRKGPLPNRHTCGKPKGDSSAQVEARTYQTLIVAQDDGYPESIMPQQPAKHEARYFHPSGRGKSGVGGARRDKHHPLVPPPGSTRTPNRPQAPKPPLHTGGELYSKLPTGVPYRIPYITPPLGRLDYSCSSYGAPIGAPKVPPPRASGCAWRSWSVLPHLQATCPDRWPTFNITGAPIEAPKVPPPRASGSANADRGPSCRSCRPPARICGSIFNITGVKV